jgi:hypothetical protein
MDLLKWEVIEHLLLSAGMLVAPLALYVLVRRNLLIEKADPRRRAYSQPGELYAPCNKSSPLIAFEMVEKKIRHFLWQGAYIHI